MRRVVYGQLRRYSSSPVADTTFSYRTHAWTTSEGVKSRAYRYVIADPPAHHPLRKDLSAAAFALVPALDVCTGGKEDLRALAKSLSDHGYTVYLLEWPGWTMEGEVNWALVRCKLEHLREEYEDFWEEILGVVRGEGRPLRVAVVGDLGSALLAAPCVALGLPLRQLAAPGENAGDPAAPPPRRWALRWNAVFARTLQSDSFFAKMVQRWYFSEKWALKRRRPAVANDGVSPRLIHLRHVRSRPLTHTDFAVACGLLDPPAGSPAPVAPIDPANLFAAEAWGLEQAEPVSPRDRGLPEVREGVAERPLGGGES